MSQAKKILKDVTIIFPYYNEEKGIHKTLERVSNQTYLPSEVIFVNSSSTDQSSAIIEKWIQDHPEHPTHFKNIFRSTNNPACSKNAGIQEAKTDWLGFMDCGLKFPENWIESQWKFIESNKDTQFDSIYGHFLGEGIVDICAIAHTYGYERKRPVLPGSFIKRDLYKKVGLYSPHRRAGYDADWPLAVKKIGVKRGLNPDIVIKYDGTNYAPTLELVMKKTALYATPTVGLKHYKIPYYYFVGSIILATTSFFYLKSIPIILFLYILLRGYLLAFKKSNGFFILKKHPLSILFLPIVAIAMDLGRLWGIYKGVWFYHIKRDVKIKIKELY